MALEILPEGEGVVEGGEGHFLEDRGKIYSTTTKTPDQSGSGRQRKPGRAETGLPEREIRSEVKTHTDE